MRGQRKLHLSPPSKSFLLTFNSQAMDNFEKPPSSESLDAQWYERFKDAGSLAPYEYLNGDKAHREEEKRKFISGATENPTLDYPRIDKDRLLRDEEFLLLLKKDIKEQEENETVRQVYVWKINEKLAELRMLGTTIDGNMRRFRRYSEFVYGKPSLEIFAYTVQQLNAKVEACLTSENPDVKEAAEELRKLLPQDLPEVSIKELPSEDEIVLTRTQTLQELGSLLNQKTEGEEKHYTAAKIRDIFETALNGLKAKGWKVVIDTGSRTGISVDQEQKTIKIPESRELVFNKLQKLLFHEVGTHVARRLNGERSRLQLLGLGLDRYEKGEEGVATMREQVLEDGFKDFAGLEGHLAISLAKGLDGHPRDFRGVYEILEKYSYLKALASGKDKNKALLSAQKTAWNKTVRTFRGTNCATPGTCFTKDIAYREGNIGVWEVVKQNPAELLRFSVGKYDPANPRHILILTLLGFTDADLRELEK